MGSRPNDVYSPPARGLLIHCWCSSAEGRAGVECGWKPAGRRQVASAPPGRHARFQCHEVPTSFSSTSTNAMLHVKLCNVISLGRACHPPPPDGREARSYERARTDGTPGISPKYTFERAAPTAADPKETLPSKRVLGCSANGAEVGLGTSFGLRKRRWRPLGTS